MHVSHVKRSIFDCKVHRYQASDPRDECMASNPKPNIEGETLTFCRNVGKGFFFLASEDSDALHNALLLSPFKSK